MNDKIYLHEYIDVILHGRAEYFELATSGHAKAFGTPAWMRHFGVWGTFGTTARWPEVTNLWELDGWDGLARKAQHQMQCETTRDAALRAWRAKANQLRSGGFSRVLVPAPYSLSFEQFRSNKDIVGAKLFYQERISVRAGTADEYLALLGEERVPQARALGFHLLGAYKTAFRNDSEVLVIWAASSFDTWAEYEIAWEQSAEAAKWRDRTKGIALDWVNNIMVSAPKSPTRTGAQPEA
jgi:hypothetical protein